jgi:hypothetical protein
MRRLAAAALLFALSLALSGCGASKASKRASGSTSDTPRCPEAWKAAWQQLADQIGAPVYCPSWMPSPLDARIGGPYSYGRFVERDRSYLIPFIWQETTPTGGEEVHVNFRGYPGRTSIPICEDTITVKGRTVHPKIPCFSDARGRKRFPLATVTVYTANQGADTWHVLYAWRHRGSLYAISEHVAPPYSYSRVLANLDRMMRGLVLLEPPS